MEPGPVLAPLARIVGAAAQHVRGRLLERRPLDIDETDEPLDYMRAWTAVTPTRVPHGVMPRIGTIEAREWLVDKYRAVACGEGFATVVLTNRTRRPIRLTALRAEAVERQPAYSGSRIDHDPAGASDVEGVFFDLDSPDKEAEVDLWPEAQTGAPEYFRARQVLLAAGESQTFAVRARTRSDYCRWRITADAIVRGHRRTITGRRTYEVSAAADAAERLAWHWWEEPPRLGPR